MFEWKVKVATSTTSLEKALNELEDGKWTVKEIIPIQNEKHLGWFTVVARRFK